MGYTTGHRWTENDEIYLRANYLELTNKELAEHFELNDASIEHKLGRLGLKRPIIVIGAHRSKGIRNNEDYMKRRIAYGRQLGSRLKGDSEYKQNWKKSQAENPVIQKHRTDFGDRMHKDPVNKAKMLKGMRLSEKFKNQNRLKVKKILEDPILNTKRLDALRTAKASEVHRKKIRAEGNPMWKGGLSFEPYTPEFNALLKSKVLERYGNTCQICGKAQEERKLDTHHIDYDKKNNQFSNLIPLCKVCHSKTNTKRVYWQNYFKEENKR